MVDNRGGRGARSRNINGTTHLPKRGEEEERSNQEGEDERRGKTV